MSKGASTPGQKPGAEQRTTLDDSGYVTFKEECIYTVPQERLDELEKKKSYVQTKIEELGGNINHVQAPRLELNVNGRGPPTVIAPFNFKGGVGKTTITINLAAELAKTHRVLIFDCDPQCNLTSFFVPAETHPHGLDDGESEAVLDSAFSATDKTVVCDVLQKKAIKDSVSTASLGNEIYSRAGIKNIMDPLGRMFKGRSDDVEFSRAYLCAEPFELKDRLLIVPGSPMLYDLDAKLNKIPDDQEYKCKTSFSALFRQAAWAVQADFVLVDCGPASSLLNKCILLACDYILPPSFGDYFSLSSMHNFLNSLYPAIVEELDCINKAAKAKDLKEYLPVLVSKGYVAPKNAPKILPFIITNYKTCGLASAREVKEKEESDSDMYKPDPKKVTHAYGKFIAAMDKLVNAPNVFPEETKTMLCPDGQCMVLPLFKQMTKVIPFSQEWAVPGTLLTQSWFKQYHDSLPPSQRISDKEKKLVLKEAEYLISRMHWLACLLERNKSA